LEIWSKEYFLEKDYYYAMVGLFYQDDAEIGIPKRWIDEIVNLDLVKEICDTFSKSLINC